MNIAEEQEVISKVRKGNTESYRNLVDAYGAKITALVYKMTGCMEDAEEIAQDAFVKAFFSLNKYRGESSFSTWLFRIAYNLTITFLRKKKRLVLKDDMEFTGESFDDSLDNTLYKELMEERYEALEKALGQLTPDIRSLLVLFYEENKSLAELVEITGLSLSNVKIRMLRGRKKLAELIEKSSATNLIGNNN